MGGAAGDGFTVAIDDIASLQKTWQAQRTQITSMTGQLASMPDEIAAAANAAMRGKSKSEQQSIISLAKSAQQSVNAALSAVRTLAGQLSSDADNLGQTAETYRHAELTAKDHVTSVGQLASYSGPAGGGPGAPASGGGAAGAGADGGGAGGIADAIAGGVGGAIAGAGASVGGGTGTPVAPGAPATSAQVKEWVQQAIKVLEQHGVPASKLDPNAIALIIQHESGGNPNAVNNYDSNAAAGHPSQGLMQTIAPTFSQYSLPGHGNILNPVDNIVAGCQYAISRYGSLNNVPGVVAVAQGGSYVGY